MSAAPKKSFVSRNIIAIVMIPSIIGIHYGWSLMQKNRTLVAQHEEIDAPPVQLAKYLWQQLKGFGESSAKDGQATAATKTVQAVAPAVK